MEKISSYDRRVYETRRSYWKFFAIAYFCSFYDGHLVRLWCSITNSWKRKGPAFKLPQKDSLRSQGIGFAGQECSVDK